MSSIGEIKERPVTDTPLLLFDCTLNSGATERWSTHAVDFAGQHYNARVLKHDLFEMQAASDDGIDAIARVSLWLANADSHFSEIERSAGWKGSRVTVRFVFYDLRAKAATSDAAVLFKGITDAPDEITESSLRVTVINSLNLQRALLPDVRVERRCPWKFPATAEQRTEAASGGAKGKYSPFYRCGYCPDVAGGLGNLSGSTPFTACDRSRGQCETRGMFSRDGAGRDTRRFGAIEFVPPTTVVRSYGEKGSHLSQALTNETRYNDFIPLIYGTAWYAPPIIFSKNDGNLTRMEVLLGMGEIESVVKVLVNDVDVPLGVTGKDMTATGWFNIVTIGRRNGEFNAGYIDSSGAPLGDPYGSMAVLNVVVPNRVNDGRNLPQIQVLAEGLRLERFGTDGRSLGESFTNNPAWVLLDVLRRCGWKPEDIDTPGFARAAAVCAEMITAHDAHGNAIDIPRFQCNLLLQRRRTAADVIRGIRNSARLFLVYGVNGLLTLRVENAAVLEQATKPDGSNAISDVDGGWPAYEFGDGTDGLSGILRKGDGQASIRLWSRSTADTPNRLTAEFQDAFNEYQQDSLSVTDVHDTLLVGQEINLTLPALGIPNFNQAARIALFQLNKSITGNTYVELETTVRGLELRPGDLITVTYLKEGFDRQFFRIIKIAPGLNYRTALITAQIHDDRWYDDDVADPFSSGSMGRQQQYGVGMPRPLAGKVRDENGNPALDIGEKDSVSSDGTTRITLAANFAAPRQPVLTGLGIPMISLAARSEDTGGTLSGDQTLYYAVSARDVSGQESPLSFVVRATIPAGTNTNLVTLTGLSFSSNTSGFDVYRGETPSELLRIAVKHPVETQFADNGIEAELTPPPDANYDHANIYWRLELQPEYAATIHGAQTIGNETVGMAPHSYAGMIVRITRGTGVNQERTVTANDATTLTLSSNWTVVPDDTSWFVVAEPAWHFGAAGSLGPLTFDVPNRIGATLHVCGRSANVHDWECAYKLSPVTRARITGGSAALDTAVPEKPVFGLITRQQGEITVGAVSFTDLTNTRTVSSATLTLHYWNELSSPSRILLNSDVGADATSISLSRAGTALAGDLIQIDTEILAVTDTADNGTTYTVGRASQGSQAVNHLHDKALYHLSKSTFNIPFARDFFGSPASGDFTYSMLLPDVRLASAEMLVTNAIGNSEMSTACLTDGPDWGMRTMSGGQISIQVNGYLAVETGATPPLVVQNTHAVRDVFAVIREAPVGGIVDLEEGQTPPLRTVELDVLQAGEVYCHLSIPENSTYSNAVSGFGLPPLRTDQLLTLDVTGVPQAAESKPGRDLTVTIRL